MPVRDTGTEQLIKDTAKKVFFAEGRLNATTQDIADAAGVSRTLVNYYYRSKDVLFEQVFKEGMQEFGQRIDQIILSPIPFKKKIIKFTELFFAELIAYPYKEVFMLTEINSHGFAFPHKEEKSTMPDFLKEVEAEMEKGTVKKMKPINFMLNLFSLMAYPILTRPLFKIVFELSDKDYDKLLNDRKKMILEMILN